MEKQDLPNKQHRRPNNPINFIDSPSHYLANLVGDKGKHFF